MKLLRSILLVTFSGLAGLALIYTDRVPIPLGSSRVAFGIVFYLVIGYLLARWNVGRRPTAWALAAGWGPQLLGLVGLTEALFEPARGDPLLATVFLSVPAFSAFAGSRFALARASRDEASL